MCTASARRGRGEYPWLGKHARSCVHALVQSMQHCPFHGMGMPWPWPLLKSGALVQFRTGPITDGIKHTVHRAVHAPAALYSVSHRHRPHVKPHSVRETRSCHDMRWGVPLVRVRFTCLCITIHVWRFMYPLSFHQFILGIEMSILAFKK